MVSGWLTQNGWFRGPLLASECYLSMAECFLASKDSSRICDAAAEQLAQEIGVPLSVLRALMQTETGRGPGDALWPWPWTVNMQGKGVWLDTEDHARMYVFSHLKRGARSFDVGCFQINYRWHGQALHSIEEMFDPLIDTRYAAKFLGDLCGELGDWTQAADAYHARARKSTDRYMTRYAKIKRALPHSTPPDENAPVLSKQKHNTLMNRYSLLMEVAVPNGKVSLVSPSRTGWSLFAVKSGS